MIVVFGNIKGGNGKSTLAVHVAVDLLYRGYRVHCIDCDGGQGTTSRYWENRGQFKKTLDAHAHAAHKAGLRWVPMPTSLHRLSPKTQGPQDLAPLLQAIQADTLRDPATKHAVVIDTAGYDSDLSRHAHGLAQVLVTPMNDSAIDLDLLVNVTDSPKVGQLPLSQYALLVWDQRMQRAHRGQPALEWIVVRNRMHALMSRNQVQLGKILQALSGRIGFHVGPTVAERVIFRELFAYGLTILDHDNVPASHQAAQMEVRAITDAVLALAEKAISVSAAKAQAAPAPAHPAAS